MSAPTAEMLVAWADLVEKFAFGYIPTRLEQDSTLHAIADYLTEQAHACATAPAQLQAGTPSAKSKIIIGSCTRAATEAHAAGLRHDFGGLVFPTAPALYFSTDEAIYKLVELSAGNPQRCYFAFKEVASVRAEFAPQITRYFDEG